MANIKIGTFETKISGYRDIDVDGIKHLDLINSKSFDGLTSEYGSDFIDEVGINDDSVVIPSSDRSLTGGDFKVIWSAYISKNNLGIEGTWVNIDGILGTLKIEEFESNDIDRSDDNAELVEWEIEIDSAKMNNLLLEVDDQDNVKITNEYGLYPQELLFIFKEDKSSIIKVSFRNYND